MARDYAEPAPDQALGAVTQVQVRPCFRSDTALPLKHPFPAAVENAVMRVAGSTVQTCPRTELSSRVI